MTENKIINLGEVSHFISQFFRYTVILILLTAVGVGTVGFGALLGVIFFKFIQKMVPFKISINNDFSQLIQQKIDLKKFRKKFIIKLIYNIVIFVFLLSLAGGIPYLDNSEDKILFLVLSGIFICPLLFQFYYFKIVNDYIKLHKDRFSQNLLATNVDMIGGKEKEELSKSFVNRVKDSTTKTLQFLSSKNKSNWIKSLSHSEIIIISLIIGAVIFLLLGYNFGETEGIYYNTQKSRGYSDRIAYSSHKEEVFRFNYATAFAGFIISSGISYMLLNKICKRNEDRR